MKERGQKTKRGLSPVIASLLLVTLVMVLAGIVFLWARGFISEQVEKMGQPIENICSSVSFEAAFLEFQGATTTGMTRTLEVVNQGDIDIYYLELKLFDSKGNSKLEKFKFNVDKGVSVTGSVILDINGEVPQKVMIYPALIGNIRGKALNRAFTCLNQGKTVML